MRAGADPAAMAADMAEAADSHSYSNPLSRALRARRFPSPSPAVAYAIRFAVAVSAAIWLGKAPGLVGSHSTWILITVLMLVQPTTGASLSKALLRAAGTLAAAFTAIGLFGLFAQDPPLLMMGLFFTQVLGAYGFSGSRFQYAWFVFAFTTAIVLGDALSGQLAVETVAFERASMVGIGIALVFVVDSLIWPTRAEPQLREALADRARLLGDALGRAIAASVDPRGGAPAASAPGSASLASQLGLVNAARSELGASRTTLDALARLVMLLEILASHARVLATPIEMPGAPEAERRPLAAALSGLARRVEAALEEIAAAVTASRAPSLFSDDLEHALLTLEGEVQSAQRIDPSAALEFRVAALRDLIALLGTIEAPLSAPRESGAVGRSPSLLSFRPDPFRMKAALRTGVAVVVAFLVPIALGWPVNIMVAPVVFMVAVLTRGAAVQTLSALVAVVALAWLVADLLIVYVAPHLGRAPVALVASFPVAAAFAYIAARRPKLAPLPSIGGLIVFLSVYGGTSAPMDVYGSYSTVCYMALALGVGWLMGRLMWPATAAELFRQRVAAQLGLCLEAVRGDGDSGDSDRGRRATGLIQGFAVHSAQLGPLHQQALLEPVERGLDPPLRARILALATDLMDAAVGYHPGSLDPLLDRAGERFRPLRVAMRRGDEALLQTMRSTVAILRGEASRRASGLAEARQAVAECIDELRADASSPLNLDDEEKRRVLVLIEARRRLFSRQLAIEQWLDDWHDSEVGRPR